MTWLICCWFCCCVLIITDFFFDKWYFGCCISRKHWCGWEGATSESEAATDTATPASEFFFGIRANSCWTGPIRTKSGRIGGIGSYWLAAKTDRNGWKRAKSTLNHAGTAKIGFEWGPNILNLSFLNFILNICCFFCVFFFVLCFLPLKIYLKWKWYNI